jgi:hypothetical protein
MRTPGAINKRFRLYAVWANYRLNGEWAYWSSVVWARTYLRAKKIALKRAPEGIHYFLFRVAWLHVPMPDYITPDGSLLFEGQQYAASEEVFIKEGDPYYNVR